MLREPDLKRYTVEDLIYLKAHAEEALAVIQGAVAQLSIIDVPAARLIHIHELEQKITRYQEEITKRQIARGLIDAGRTTATVQPLEQAKTLLFLAANPTDTARLSLDREQREVAEALQRSKHRASFKLVSRVAVKPRDVLRALLDEMPAIIHFSGHGTGVDGLVLEDDSGSSKLASADALTEVFANCRNLECVVLNACYSGVQAAAIVRHIEYVIGIQREIPDRTAIAFASGYYDALGAGRTYMEAFEWALSYLKLEGLSGGDLVSMQRRQAI